MDDLTGLKFNKLIVLRFDRKSESKKYFWICQCDCGNQVSYRSDALKQGRRKSCGCIKSPNDDEYLKKLEKRLLKNSKRNGDCLEWQKRFNPGGYGIIKIRCKEKKQFQTSPHRVAYMIWINEIPNGMYVLHKCDNRKCIEPSHLYLGTHHDNMKDMVSKNRQDKRPGEKHHLHKFCDEDIYEIRRLWDEKKETQSSLSKKYGVSLSCMHNICMRKSWKHIAMIQELANKAKQENN